MSKGRDRELKWEKDREWERNRERGGDREKMWKVEKEERNGNYFSIKYILDILWSMGLCVVTNITDRKKGKIFFILLFLCLLSLHQVYISIFPI